MEHFCDIILNLDKWFKRCHLKDFLPRALAALMLGGPEQFCNHVQLLYLKLGEDIVKKKFTQCTNGRRRIIQWHTLSLQAQVG